ncbi:MAG: cobaltochelatase subunit CobN [Deltaproteobacteria bacterium]|nr:cobaltochelatase subunit CobN [Deltaproteobacteria bacterium]MBW2068696.1 cobaltochelatase subunit CobN [Deltaproteobacteria bacterium]
MKSQVQRFFTDVVRAIHVLPPHPDSTAGRNTITAILLTILVSMLLTVALLPAATLKNRRHYKITFVVMDVEGTRIHDILQKSSKLKFFDVEFFTPSEIESAENQNLKAIALRLHESDIIFVHVMDNRLADFVLRHLDIKPEKSPFVYAVGASRNDTKLARRGFIYDTTIRKYHRYLSAHNVVNMILKAVHDRIDPSVSFEPPETFPTFGIYHPEAPSIFTCVEDYLRWYLRQKPNALEKPWVGLTVFRPTVANGQTGPVDKIIKKLEAAGINVITAFGYPDRELIKRFFLEKRNGKTQSRVSLILSFTLKFSSALRPETKKIIKSLDVPIINAIDLVLSTIDDWKKSPQGIRPIGVAWTLANPEISGLIEPSVLMGKVKHYDAATGKTLFSKKIVEDNLNHLVARIKKWLNLQKKPNAEKRVAILIYNHSQGKQNIGASYLNVFESIRTILFRMKADGYTVDLERIPDAETLKNLILSSARNVGSWAPGELKALASAKDVVKIPMETYLKRYKNLPQDFRQNVENQWGPPESSTIMTLNGRIILPALFLGNVVIMPEPARGWGDDPMKLYHSPTLYPHHQYIAAYLWLKHDFKADAMIHLGTHATHEWLPGKQAGLSTSCPPEVLITDIPNIYPYIVDDVGEGIQAKRRGRGVIIDHLVPPVKKSGLYGEYAELYERIQNYHQAIVQGSPTVQEQFREIVEMAEALGIEKELGISLAETSSKQNTEEALEKLEHYLLKIRESFIPHGLHTFGKSPSGDGLKEMIKAISNVHRQNGKTVSDQKIRNALEKSGSAELDSLMAALQGKYIPSAEGNDPLRNPNAIPTGKNFYGFNPEKIPTPEAYELGKKAAEQIIQERLKKSNSYPEKVAVVLWAVETIRNGGVNESTVLALLGIKPIWDSLGRVSGLQPIPGSKLKRPRIDVLINPSGLYRDLFPDKLKFLDRAVKLALVQKDVENLIRKHTKQLEKRLREQGYGEASAKLLSRARIFSEPPGTYGTGVAELAGMSGVWKRDDEIAEVYLNRVGYIFGEKVWGKEAKDLFKAQLAGVDTVVHSFSSNIYGAMDNDDVFQYVGGLSLATKKFRGTAPKAIITMQRQPGKVHVEDLAEVLGSEMRSRYLNPKWIRGMKKEGYAGAREMAKFVEYFWGFQVTTPDSVNEKQWEQIFQVYIEDKYDLDLKRFFRKSNPWAYQSVTARMLEAIRKGYWKANDSVKRRLAVEYAQSVVERGIACCDHTCNNPFLNQMVASIISIPGLMNPEMVKKFEATVEKAIGKSLREQASQRRRLQKKLRKSVENGPEALEKMVEGYKMEEIKQKPEETKQLSSSSIRWITIGIVVLIGLLVIEGFRKSTKNTN